MKQQPMLHAAVGSTEPALLGEQTAGSLVRNVWRVYRRHFMPILLTSFLSTFPLLLFAQLIRGSSTALELVATFAYLVSAFVASGALTITLSDICLGTVPTVRRSFSRVLRDRTWLKLLTTGLLAGVLILLGTLLLLLPGIWVAIRSVFSATIVVLEGRSGRDAIRRSFDLTRGQFWHLLGLLTLILLIIGLLGFLFGIFIAIVVGLVAGFGSVGEGGTKHVIEALANVMNLGLLQPAAGIAMVLLYYDQRVRRESYDAHALSEDLMR